MKSYPACPIHPLASHLEFSLVYSYGYQEYRLENKDLSLSTTLRSLLIIFLLIFCFQFLFKIHYYLSITVFVVLFAKSVFFQLLYESVILLPPHGIQLEAHYGLPGLKLLFSDRQFVPAVALDGALINEGLKGWNVRYFLTIIRKTSCTFNIQLAYRNLLPDHPVLLEALVGIHETILSNVLQKPQK